MVTPPPIQLGNLGMADSLILMVLALVVFGPRRLPQIGRQIGKLMYEFRKASNDFKFQMEEELRVAEEADRRKKEEAERQAQLALTPPPPPSIEAQADIGAVEAPAAGAPAASPYPGESTYPEPYPPDDVPLPRIQPPVTGAPVPAARPGAGTEASAESGLAATAEPVASAAAPPPADQPETPRDASSDPTGTEAISQHG